MSSHDGWNAPEVRAALDDLTKLDRELRELLKRRRDRERIEDLVARMGWQSVALGRAVQRQAEADERCRGIH